MGSPAIVFVFVFAIVYQENERKSIPIDFFESNGYPITLKWNPRIDYLQVVDKLINKGDNSEKVDNDL